MRITIKETDGLKLTQDVTTNEHFAEISNEDLFKFQSGTKAGKDRKLIFDTPALRQLEDFLMSQSRYVMVGNDETGFQRVQPFNSQNKNTITTSNLGIFT